MIDFDLNSDSDHHHTSSTPHLVESASWAQRKFKPPFSRRC